MLSIAPLKSASTGEYYEKDDYYFGKGEGGGGEGASALTWGGKGAGALGLSGAATHEDFKAVLEGRNPDASGPPLSMSERRERDGKDPIAAPENVERAARRPGLDMTFSAPKSISLAVLLGGDERLLQAHNDAVTTSMAFVEKHYAVTRVRNGDGGIDLVKTDNLLWAQTNHSTSRAGDPQLHTHVVVSSATFAPDGGEWRALESRPIFENRQLVGMIYQGELAKAAMALGYDVRDHKGGTFELAGFSDNLRQSFSKSTDRITKNIEREKPDTGAAKDTVKLMGRPKKLDVPESGLAAVWDRQSAEIGENVPAIVHHYQSREVSSGSNVTDRLTGRVSGIASKLADLGERLADVFAGPMSDPYGYQDSDPKSGRDLQARQALSYGLQVSETGTAVFTRGQVLREAISHMPKGMTVDRLERQLAQLERDGRVQGADVKIHDGVTTDRALKLEASIVATMKTGLSHSQPIYEMAAGVDRVASGGLEAAGTRLTLSRGQAEAATLILTSPDRIIAVQGAAGAGKSTMFALVGAAAREQGADIVGLAPTHTARSELAEKTGFEAHTIQHFLKRHDNLTQPGAPASADQRKDWMGKTVVVDEASMLSNGDVQRLFAITNALDVEKLVLVGDQRQLGSPQAGAPFRYLLGQEIPQAVVDKIVRQKNPELLDVVTHLSRGESTAGVRKLGQNVVEIGRGEGDGALAAATYRLWRDAKDEGVTRPVLTVTQNQREAANDLILADLQGRGEISPLGEARSRLAPVHLGGPARWSARNYEEGQVLVFHARLEGAGIHKGEHVSIVGRDTTRQNNLLTVLREDGRFATINLNSLGRDGREKFVAYEERPGGQLYAGGAMVWERTDKDRGLFAGQVFTPIGEKDGRVQVRLAGGETTWIDQSDPQMRFVGPGYAMTTHRSQSLTMQDNPIGMIHSRHANQALAYVQVSRAVHGMTVITDDRNLLIQRLGRLDGMNLIASLNLNDGANDAMTKSAAMAPTAPDQDQTKAPERAAAVKEVEPWDPSQLKPEPEKSFVRDRPYTRDRSI